MEKNIKVIIVEPGKPAYLKVIKDKLEVYQEIVGGLIELVYPFDDDVILVDNEEGKLIGLPLNRKINEISSPLNELLWDGWNPDIIQGTFLLVQDDHEGGFTSLSDELAEKYLKRFAIPEEY